MSIAKNTHPLRTSKSSDGFTLVELLVVIAIIGTLVALLLPAVQSAREAARRISCTNNLRQTGLALLNYALVKDSLPIGCQGCGQFPVGKRTSWLTRLLPHLEQQSLADQYDDSLSATAPVNQAIAIQVAEFLCPSEPSDKLVDTSKSWRGCAYTDYGGVFGVEGSAAGTGQAIDEANLGVFLYNDPVHLSEITDGTSKTIASAELLDRRISENVWINGENLFAQEESTPINAASGLGGDIGSPHPGGALALYCDGHVEWLSNSIAQRLLNGMLTKAGSEVLP